MIVHVQTCWISSYFPDAKSISHHICQTNPMRSASNATCSAHVVNRHSHPWSPYPSHNWTELYKPSPVMGALPSYVDGRVSNSHVPTARNAMNHSAGGEQHLSMPKWRLQRYGGVELQPGRDGYAMKSRTLPWCETKILFWLFGIFGKVCLGVVDARYTYCWKKGRACFDFHVDWVHVHVHARAKREGTSSTTQLPVILDGF